VVLAALVAAGLAGRPLALAMFCAAAFTVAAIGQELWSGARARRALKGEPLPLALVRLVGRNRRRYGGYAVHVGIAVALVGVAASSTFHDARDVVLGVGRQARVGAYEVRYVRPVAALSREKVTLGAVLDVRRDGRHVATLVPTRGYYASPDQGDHGRIGRFFEGESTSEVGLRADLRRDIWTAVQPDLTALAPMIARANRQFPTAGAQLEGLLVRDIVRRYIQRPPPGRFRLIVSPLVSWIWLGGVILVAGALVAVWPMPSTVRRRARARSGVARAADPSRRRWRHA
jgi:cytochrome c-type biogenesis protein CcmF